MLPRQCLMSQGPMRTLSARELPRAPGALMLGLPERGAGPVSILSMRAPGGIRDLGDAKRATGSAQARVHEWTLPPVHEVEAFRTCSMSRTPQVGCAQFAKPKGTAAKYSNAIGFGRASCLRTPRSVLRHAWSTAMPRVRNEGVTGRVGRCWSGFSLDRAAQSASGLILGSANRTPCR
jgi:hypothetical protein